ncbi:MAG: SpoIID/LytB domain-containing protein, partial [Acidimicrobiales bacterium]
MARAESIRRGGARGLVAAAGALAVGAAGMAGARSLPAARPSPAPRVASPFPGGTVTLVGHGWGHGRGMGQWGALGYALQGQTYQQILAHFYGGTIPGRAADNPIRVVITENDGNDTVVTSGSAFHVASYTFAAGQAARLHLLASGSFQLSGGASCTATTWKPLATLASGEAVAVPAEGGPDATGSQVLQLCQQGGNLAYRGDIEAASYQGSPRTVNVVPLESYLRGVVAAESPALWGTLGATGPEGQPAGFQELEAQAVAARSYALSGLGQYGYADICDTTACQVYLGLAGEHPTTDAAVAGTAGQVLFLSSGQVARTEYSSSTGGYTAGGDFPAVPDTGDSVCVAGACNPNHDWTDQVPVSTIQADWPQLGTLLAVEVTARNGLGDLGGRVEQLTLVGGAGQVELTGASFADTLGLRSDWFAVEGTGPGSLPARLVGYRVADEAGNVFGFGAATSHGSLVGKALNAPLVGVAGTPDGGGYWLVASDGGVFSFGDASFHGSTGDIRLNHPIVGMAPTPDGGGY